MALLSETLRKYSSNECVYTGDADIDRALASVANWSDPDSTQAKAGIPSKSYMELSGFPGSGKTAVWLSLTLEILKRGQKVLYVSCDYASFPFVRAQTMNDWVPERFESRIDEIVLGSLEELLMLDSQIPISDYGIVIIDHYDHLIKKRWSRASRDRAATVLIQKCSELARHSCIITTCGCVKYRNEEDCTLVAPATYAARVTATTLIRILIYKNTDEESVLSLGTKFKITQNGPESLNTSTSDPIPLYILSNKRRLTPQRGGSGINHFLSGSDNKRRRPSISTPSRSVQKRMREGREHDRAMWDHQLSTPLSSQTEVAAPSDKHPVDSSCHSPMGHVQPCTISGMLPSHSDLN